ncbi:MAG: DUF4372 domain-containing protein [Desulfobacterales bacterium]|nr:DUF4372 domain-containing protein [Desulfobacterales bacterium]
MYRAFSVVPTKVFTLRFNCQAKPLAKKQGGSTMVRHASLFSQLVALFHRGQFHSLVFRHKAERYCKGFDS